MWLLIKIEDLNDLRQHEKERILIHDSDIIIQKTELLKLDIKAVGTAVHPNTLDMERITPYKMKTYLIQHGWVKQPYGREEVTKFTNQYKEVELVALVPTTNGLIDYRRTMEIILETLALHEQRSAYEIFIEVSRQETTFKWNGSWEDGKDHNTEVGMGQYYLRMCHCGNRRGQHTGKSRLEKDAKCPVNNILEA